MSVFDLDGDGVIRQEEFVEKIRKLVLALPRDRFLFAFRVNAGPCFRRLCAAARNGQTPHTLQPHTNR